MKHIWSLTSMMSLSSCCKPSRVSVYLWCHVVHPGWSNCSSELTLLSNMSENHQSTKYPTHGSLPWTSPHILLQTLWLTLKWIMEGPVKSELNPVQTQSIEDKTLTDRAAPLLPSLCPPLVSQLCSQWIGWLLASGTKVIRSYWTVEREENILFLTTLTNDEFLFSCDELISDLLYDNIANSCKNITLMFLLFNQQS